MFFSRGAAEDRNSRQSRPEVRDVRSHHLIPRDQAGGIWAEADYQDNGKWPVAGDGAGHALFQHVELEHPSDGMDVTLAGRGLWRGLSATRV